MDTPENLSKAVDKTAHTHTSAGVKPEHYSIVGECLLQAIMDVAGTDEQSPVIDTWGRAFITIAEILMAREKELYESSQHVA